MAVVWRWQARAGFDKRPQPGLLFLLRLCSSFYLAANSARCAHLAFFLLSLPNILFSCFPTCLGAVALPCQYLASGHV